ncbi:MAG TPA: glycosyltransferase family 39 protein [Novosphingobium sp.]|nr:glycosyltransferase family 39 protein [Novosphingobium sp.]
MQQWLLGLLASDAMLAMLVFALAAMALRLPTLGNPVIHVDEEFYLLVGDRMLHGALPFVDIWDRKPIGLFILFAAIREMGGDGIVQYQLAAAAATVATSLVIWRIAREIATPAGAIFAGLGYQLALSAVFCFGGQAPVFYNLLMAVAGLGALRVFTGRDNARLLVNGASIMAVVGIAIQIKYTVIFEGMAFGLALMWRGHLAGWSRGRIAAAATLWCSVALAPTLMAWGYYASIGHGNAFFQANFVSIFGRVDSFGEALFRLGKEMLLLLPVWLAIFVAPRHIPGFGRKGARQLAFLRYWAGAAVLGFLVFGTWYDHYVAPLLVPLMIVAAPALGHRRPHFWYTGLLIGLGAIASVVVTAGNVYRHGTRADVDHAVQMIEQARGNGCLYVNEGDPILYHLTGSCMPTRWPFPGHLAATNDAASLGIDAAGEMAATMARHPSVVMISARPLSPMPNLRTRAIMAQVLDRDYEAYANVRIGNREFRLYRLKARA